MIWRILPAVSAVTTRMPPGLRRAYGDISNWILDTSTVYRHLRSTVAEMGSALLDFSRIPETGSEHRLCDLASPKDHNEIVLPRRDKYQPAPR